jgi:ubiquinone/menaquinone biosynthesis C-methylase UbiE
MTETEADTKLATILDGFAPFYDLEYDAYDADLLFYTQYAARAAPGRKAGAAVLDLGCGTGRVARALAAAGHRVTGVDGSPAMLARARARADAAGLPLRLVHATLQALPGPATLGRFDLALCAVNSFAYLTTVAEQLALLRQVYALLRPGGLLLLDLTPVPPDGPMPDHDEVLHQGLWTRSDGTTVAKFVTGTWNPATQIHAVTWIYDVTDRDGVVRRTLLPQPFRYLYRYEAEHLLARAGLPLGQVYGDYDLTPYAAGAERLLLVAQREE